jgi:hypothetical protein
MKIPLDLSNLQPRALRRIRKVSRDPNIERKIENSSENVLTLIEFYPTPRKQFFYSKKVLNLNKYAMTLKNFCCLRNFCKSL